MGKKKSYRLAPRELEIMNVVWERGEATVRDVCQALRRPAAYTTVLTMMRILESKGLLKHRAEGRTFVYRAAVPRSQVQRSMLLELRDALFAGSTSMLINTLVSGAGMSEDEREELRKMLESLEEDAPEQDRSGRTRP
jgi:predicted transcriptional regulator